MMTLTSADQNQIQLHHVWCLTASVARLEAEHTGDQGGPRGAEGGMNTQLNASGRCSGSPIATLTHSVSALGPLPVV